MNSRSFCIIVGLALSVLAGCSSLGGKPAALANQNTSIKTLRANGFSQLEETPNLPANHSWLMAQNAAKSDAYRNLADQLYTEALDRQNTVGTQVMKDEAYRVYLDIYLREARAVDYRTVQDTLNATMELNLTSRFYRCMSGDKVIVKQCLQEDNKLPLTRLGNRPAMTSTVNLACGTRDCGEQYYVQGFSKERNPVDNVLLNVGMYDLEWDAHTGASLFARLFFLQEAIHGF